MSLIFDGNGRLIRTKAVLRRAAQELAVGSEIIGVDRPEQRVVSIGIEPTAIRERAIRMPAEYEARYYQQPVTEQTEYPLALSTRRVAIYISNADSRRAANQRAAMQRYADNIDWVVTVIEDDRHAFLTVPLHPRLTWSCAGGPAISETRSSCSNGCPLTASNF